MYIKLKLVHIEQQKYIFLQQEEKKNYLQYTLKTLLIA